MKECPSCKKKVDDDVRLCPYCGYSFLGDEPTTVGFSDIYFPELDIIKEKLANKYKVLGLIGRGGFSTVLKLKDTVLERICALKILSRDLITDPEMLERFKREARLYAKLDHPNIVQVYDVGFYKNVAYIIMKYIDGITLKDLIKERAPLEFKEIIRISQDIASVLEYMHSKGIIHRDIKPANIMIQKDNGRAILTDFGLAKNLETTKFTATGKIMGSPHYLAPEQAKGEKVDERTDIYSLGITMFEMATGKLPFEGESAVQIVLKHIREELPKPSTYNKKLDKDLEKIILKATKRNPAERFSSVKELKSALEEVGKKSEYIVSEKKRRVVPSFILVLFSFLLSILAVYKKEAVKNYFNNVKKLVYKDKEVENQKEEVITKSLKRKADRKEKNKGVLPTQGKEKIMNKEISNEQKKSVKQAGNKTGGEIKVNNEALSKGSKVSTILSTQKQKTVLKKSINTYDVTFSSNAKAKLYIDDKYYGIIPPSKSIRLKKGKHKIIYLRETPKGIRSKVKEVIISRGVKEISEKFETTAIIKKIVAVPWAKVYIDGKLKDITPIFNIKLKEGTHTILFKHPEYKDYFRKITVEGGETVDKIFVNLNIDSTRIKKVSSKKTKPDVEEIKIKLIYVYPWGNVYIDNKKLGLSPIKNITIPAGNHILKVVHPKFGKIEKAISFKRNLTRITINLETKTVNLKEE